MITLTIAIKQFLMIKKFFERIHNSNEGIKKILKILKNLKK